MTTTIRSIPTLPQELVDNIIDHLYDDPQTLSNCSLISHAWLPASRHHFFSKITLKAPSLNTHSGPVILPQERCRRLHSLLTKSPHLIPNIKELEICEGSPLHHPFPDVQCSTTWVTTERTLTSLFKILTHLKRLDFAATSTFHWSLLPPTFVAAFHTLLSRGSLRCLRLHSWLFPNFDSLSGMISCSPNLKALSLSLTTICNEPTGDIGLYPVTHASSPSPSNTSSQEDGHSPGTSPRASGHELVGSVSGDNVPKSSYTPLEVLTLDFVNFACLESFLFDPDNLNPHPTRTLRPLLNLSSIKELRIAHFHDAGVIEKLLRCVGGSLECLHLKPGSWKVRNFDFTHNPNLRSLRLTLDDPATAMAWATHLLQSLLVTAQRRADPHVRDASISSSNSLRGSTSATPSVSRPSSPPTSTSASTSSFPFPDPDLSSGSLSSGSLSSGSSHFSSLPNIVTSSLQNLGLEFYTDPKKIDGWEMLDSLLASPEFAVLPEFSISSEFGGLRYIEIGLFAIMNGVEFSRVRGEMRGLSTWGSGERSVSQTLTGDGMVSEEGGCPGIGGCERRVRWYQLGVKSQRSSSRLTPRVSSYERGL